jgi:uncharacterized protein (TIGR02246 family)
MPSRVDCVRRRLASALVALCLPATAFAQAAPAKEAGSDETAIRASAADYVKAFNAGDAKALAETWTADGEYVDDQGQTYRGRPAIENLFAAGFSQHPGSTLEVTVNSVKLLSPDVAIEKGVTRARPAKGPAGPLVSYTAVHVKRDGKWLVSNVTESRFAEQSNELHLQDLAWLVGRWQVQTGDKTVTFDCQWLPGKSYLSRSYTVTEKGATVGSGLQIIGWDPTLQQIVSWTFNSDGGFGHEYWAQDGARWEIDATSTNPDGASGLARNLLTKLSDNAFSWHSVDRSLNDQLLPDTQEVRVKRVVEKPAK